jgi:hypothetical protein
LDTFTGIKHDFHTTPKPQTVATILDSEITADAQQFEAVFNTETPVSPDITSTESTESPAIISAAKHTESVASVMPDEVIHIPATLPSSTAVLHATDETWKISIIKELEEMNMSTTAHTQNPGRISTAKESGNWSHVQSHIINNTEDDTYSTDLNALRERNISLEGSLKDSVLTKVDLTASTTVVSNSKPIRRDVDSSEVNAGLSAVLKDKVAEHFENISLLQKLKLDSSTASSQVHGYTSLKIDPEVPLSTNRPEYENVKVKRHAKAEDKKGNNIIGMGVLIVLYKECVANSHNLQAVVLLKNSMKHKTKMHDIKMCKKLQWGEMGNI